MPVRMLIWLEGMKKLRYLACAPNDSVELILQPSVLPDLEVVSWITQDFFTRHHTELVDIQDPRTPRGEISLTTGARLLVQGRRRYEFSKVRAKCEALFERYFPDIRHPVIKTNNISRGGQTF
jgi:hypothetical protein